MIKARAFDVRCFEIERTVPDTQGVYVAVVTDPRSDYEPTVLSIRLYKSADDLEGTAIEGMEFNKLVPLVLEDALEFGNSLNEGSKSWAY